VNAQVANLNHLIAQELGNSYMKVAIEEVIVPPYQGAKPFVNFSRKSYMFSYCQ
jgi:hypothetical protein